MFHAPQSRLGAKLAVLAALWIIVFWLTPAPSAITPRVADASTNTRPIIESQSPDATPETTITTQPLITEPAPITEEPTPGAVTPPPFDLYTVQPDETIESIAVRLLGDRKYWQAIAQMNPSVDPIRLTAGQQLRIPADMQNLQGVTTEHAPPAAPPELIYVVARNDTLSGISQKVYGRSIHWRHIQQANASIVNEDGTNLKPGMELKIPTLPADTQD